MSAVDGLQQSLSVPNPLEPNPRHFHVSWAGLLSFTVEGIRFYRDAASRKHMECRWETVQSIERLRLLHRVLFCDTRSVTKPKQRELH